MNISVKKFSKKSLSLLIALIMVFSALPLTPPISAEAAETKTEYAVWDATSFTNETSSNGTPFTFTDTNSKIKLQGVHWGAASKTSGNNYFTFNNATISTQNNISNIDGDSWSFSAKFVYSGIPDKATLATVFGIGTSTPRTYTNTKNNESTRCVADLVDIRDNGKIYLSLGSDTPNEEINLTPEQRNLLFSTSADDYKVLTVRYNSGTVTIDVNGTVIVPSTAVDSTLFRSGVSNYFVGSNVRCTEGGKAPYYKKPNVSDSSTYPNGDFIYNMNLYSLSGATYTTKTSHDNPNQTISVAGFGVVKKSGSNADRRKDNNTAINIVNDRYHSNFDFGFINFNISSLKDSGYVSVKDAICQFQARYADSGDNQGLKLYYPTQNTTEFTSNSTVIQGDVRAKELTPSTAANTAIFSGSEGTNSQHLKNTKDYYGLTEIPSGEFTDLKSDYADKRLDISKAINHALDNNLDYATVIILLKDAGNATTSGNSKWTDTYFKFTSTSINATAVDACIWNAYHPDTEHPGKHIRECEVCQKTETQDCSGGTATCTQKAICTVCGGEHGSLAQHSFEIETFDLRFISVAPNGDNNGYKYYACKNCETESPSFQNSRIYDVTDWSAYDAQKKVLDDLLADRSKFSAASFAECQNAYSDATGGITSGDKTKSQTFIDNKTKALIAAKNLLKSTVTFNVYDDTVGGNPKLLTTESFDVKYLDSKQLDIPNEYSSDYVVTSWKRNIKGVDSQIATNTSSISAVVSTNITYMLYLKKATVDDSQASGKAVVTINNKSNNVYDIGYIDLNENTAVSVSSNNITIGGVTLTAPVYSFYNLTGFNINGKIVTGTDTVNITKDTVIKPVYEPTLDAFIKRAENETFLINGKAENLAVKWNQKVVLNTIDGTEVAWIAGIDRDSNGTIDSTEKNVVGYGSSYSFYANSNVTFYTESTPVYVPKTSIGLFSYNANENKVTLVNNFYAPSGYTVKYAGVVLSTKTDNRDKLIEQTNGRFFGGESDFSGTDSNKNQLRISVTRTATTSFDMHALAYIIVQKPDGTEETVYADNVETIHYTATA